MRALGSQYDLTDGFEFRWTKELPSSQGKLLLE